MDGEDQVFLLDTAGASLPSARATALLARCLSGGASAAAMLTVGDREALLLHLRRLTLGNTVQCVVCCPAGGCGERMDLTLDVNDLLVAPYDEVCRDHVLTVEAAGVRYDLVFRLPTAADLDVAAVAVRRDPGVGGAAFLPRCVRRAEADGAPVDVERLPAEVYAAISAAVAEKDPQAELELELTCPVCGARTVTVFDTAAFFLDELERHAGRLLHDVHTLASHYHWNEADILRLPPARRAQYLAMVAADGARGAGR
ncbi:hypothetical protein ACFVZL_36215 [Streptomyces sp. NPDC058320]|uniref:T4 family baseplate hub assembly chaperone n=1 Tax=unclassified Streptomyces TaxID=2593676 RepID=UPI003629E4E9